MISQWIGTISGSASGGLIINIDPDRPSTAIVQVDDHKLPFTAFATVNVAGDSVTASLGGFISPVPVPAGVRLPMVGEVAVTVEGNRAVGTWKTDIGTGGTLSVGRFDSPATRKADEEASWSTFREEALKPDSATLGWLFRGQKSSRPLVTKFHRTKRCNLFRYMDDDVPLIPQGVLCVRCPRDLHATGRTK